MTQLGPIFRDIAHITVVTEAEYKLEFEDTPYLAVMGELWSVFCEAFGENWTCNNCTALYVFRWTLEGVEISYSVLGQSTSYYIHINPLRAKFFKRNINIYLHFVSFLHIDMTQVVEILHQIRQEPTDST